MLHAGVLVLPLPAMPRLASGNFSKLASAAHGELAFPRATVSLWMGVRNATLTNELCVLARSGARQRRHQLMSAAGVLRCVNLVVRRSGRYLARGSLLYGRCNSSGRADS